MLVLSFIANLDYGTAILLSILLIAIVMIVLAFISFFCFLIIKLINDVDKKININPRKENKLLSEDDDACIALIVATIDFNREYNKDAKLIKISRIDE